MRRRQRVGPTLDVIARKAGVSVSTVSKVLNGYGDVGAETRKRVWVLLEAAGHSGPSGRELGSGGFDLVIGRFDTPIVNACLQAACAGANDFAVPVVATSPPVLADSVESLRPWVGHVVTRRSRGVLMIEARPNLAEAALLEVNAIPLVEVNPPGLESTMGSVAVLADAEGGTAAATRRLIVDGHREIALLLDRHHPRSVAAEVGYASVMRSAGQSADVRRIDRAARSDEQDSPAPSAVTAETLTRRATAVVDVRHDGAAGSWDRVRIPARREAGLGAFDVGEPAVAVVHPDWEAMAVEAWRALVSSPATSSPTHAVPYRIRMIRDGR